MKISAFSAILLLAAVFPVSAHKNNEEAISTKNSNRQLQEEGGDRNDGFQGIEDGDAEKTAPTTNDEQREKEVDLSTMDEVETYEYLLKLFEKAQEVNHAEDVEDYEQVLADTLLNDGLTLNPTSKGRELISLPAVHCNCPVSQYYFNIEISVKPVVAVPSYCAQNWNYWPWKLGNDINKLLLDIGVGPKGVGDNVVFLAQVCPYTSYFRRRNLREQGEEENDNDHDAFVEELFTEEGVTTDQNPAQEGLANEEAAERQLYYMQPQGFLYSGGGPCRGCPYDNHDHRRRRTQLSASCSPGSSSCSGTVAYTCGGSACEGGLNVDYQCDAQDCSTVISSCQLHPWYPCQCSFNMAGFLSNLNERVRYYMRSEVVPDNPVCTGYNSWHPDTTTPQVSVTTTGVSWSSDVNYGCS